MVAMKVAINDGVCVVQAWPVPEEKTCSYLLCLQLKLEDYRDRLKRGEVLNQDQLVRFLFLYLILLFYKHFLHLLFS